MADVAGFGDAPDPDASQGIAEIPVCGNYFERRLRLWAPLRVSGPHRKPPKSKCREVLAPSLPLQKGAELCLDAVLNHMGSPMHNAVLHRIGASSTLAASAAICCATSHLGQCGTARSVCSLPLKRCPCARKTVARRSSLFASSRHSLHPARSAGPFHRVVRPSNDPPAPRPAHSPINAVSHARPSSCPQSHEARPRAITAASLHTLPSLPACVGSDFAKLGNPKKVRPKGRWSKFYECNPPKFGRLHLKGGYGRQFRSEENKTPAPQTAPGLKQTVHFVPVLG